MGRSYKELVQSILDNLTNLKNISHKRFYEKIPIRSHCPIVNPVSDSFALILAAHGAMRLYNGTVGGFGEFLNSKGFMIGPGIAWFLTIFEIAGGLLMATGYFVKMDRGNLYD